MNMADICYNNLKEHEKVFEVLPVLVPAIEEAASVIIDALKQQKKILVCGNGGSAADSQHLVAEIIGRFEKNRRAMAAVALSTDTSILTAVGNDYGFDKVFTRQVEGLGERGDVLIGISTTGNSGNVLDAVKRAREMEMRTIALVGRDGGALAKEADIAVVVPHQRTARVQEAHLFIYHFWAEMIDLYVEDV